MINRESLRITIESAFAKAEFSMRAVQSAMLELLEDMQNWTGKDIKNDPVLTGIFQGTSSGLARARLRVWMEDFTPIRVRFERDENGKNTGKVIGVKLNTKNPDWKLPEAKVNFFMDYSKAKANKAKATPSIEKAIDALFRQTARAIDGDGLSIEDARAQMLKAVQDEFAKRLLKVCESDSHKEWIEAYQAEKESAKRAA